MNRLAGPTTVVTIDLNGIVQAFIAMLAALITVQDDFASARPINLYGRL